MKYVNMYVLFDFMNRNWYVGMSKT